MCLCVAFSYKRCIYLFSYTLVEPPDGQYGAPEDNGTWNGMVGMLMRGVRLAAIKVLVCQMPTSHFSLTSASVD